MILVQPYCYTGNLEIGRQSPVAYKWANVAVENGLIKREPKTHQKNLKRLLPGVSKETRFLPSPEVVFRERKELGPLLRYIDPLTGRKRVLRRRSEEDDEV